MTVATRPTIRFRSMTSRKTHYLPIRLKCNLLTNISSVRTKPDIFNNPVGAISRSEFVTTKSGEKAYYMESQADDLSRISMFLPVGDTKAKNTVIGGAVDVNEHIHQIAKDGVFIEILKSIEFKVK